MRAPTGTGPSANGPRMPRWRASILALVAGLTLPGCQRTQPARHLLLVTIDTLRADCSSVYGHARQTTPTLERLAREGQVFEHAYSPLPLTGPAHATLMTGLYPRRHGVVANGQALGPSPATLAERLRSAGFATTAVVSAFPLDPRFGLARGFERFDAEFPAASASLLRSTWEGRLLDRPLDRRGAATTDRALVELERARRQRLFLWVHYFDPHTPYDAPPDQRALFPPGVGDQAARQAAYEAEVHFADAQLGRLLDGLERLGLRGQTAVAVTADHGEGLGEHGQAEHGERVYDEQTRVPLVVAWPAGLPRGLRHDREVGLVDLAPTLLGLVGVAASPGGDGLDLGPVLRGQAQLAERTFFLEAGYFDRTRGQAGVVGRRTKHVRSHAPGGAREELYDLRRDPRELDDLAPRRPELVAELAELLAGWTRRHRLTPRPKVRDGADQEALRALGYLD